MSEKPLTAIIVDDEPLAIEGLRLRLEKISQLKVIAEASDGDQAIHLCNTLTPDVLFLDLRLPGLNGIEVVQALQSDTLPMIVFVSAYGEYAIDAFELNAIDYVLKPANLGRLQKTVERIMQRVSISQSENNIEKDSTKEKFKLLKALGETSGLSVSELEDWLESDNPLPSLYIQELVIKNNDHEKVFLPVKDIQWIDAAGDYMCIHENNETHIVRITMKKLESQLDPKIFTRIHKSTLVNVSYIKSIKPMRNSEGILDLGNDVQLKVSRNYSSAIQQIVESKQY
ncbi:LytTR family DNA-binding domain-containing protein [Colwellia sp. 1_MG-2023]|jgi:two-component system LytT family response regulator|uniref:LytR/AlgR family response regulator transcription factor n=1 Tax=unclassified Colwellia TaxID=196834 RepID=UPI001C07F19D|nr:MULTISPECIES: LytTR family DNA-binding domain-containing protein [unclassified Colwellia]MBU2926175.1 LytTR family DNA-binding domain-containing protein [Colwellia sp. C2M11]MDO6487326.1 LytTR family DNA-binding domain-containing protein [Colwellia sp. 6_MG-2023]MDO6652404.1 LytTR family DNA-binding domain-containing protein [Colwellia sp. 3_MG-2023]MDO6665721.1 LytTR family DNA-binding domain-containing protein [Colwellia sp. 2_MG-2023]MDO6690094.1 LytTR family DNA-binding domain-containin